MSNFRIYKVINEKAYDLQDPSGQVQCTAVVVFQLLMPAEQIVSLIPGARAFWKSM